MQHVRVRVLRHNVYAEEKNREKRIQAGKYTC